MDFVVGAGGCSRAGREGFPRFCLQVITVVVGFVGERRGGGGIGPIRVESEMISSEEEDELAEPGGGRCLFGFGGAKVVEGGKGGGAGTGAILLAGLPSLACCLVVVTPTAVFATVFSLAGFGRSFDWGGGLGFGGGIQRGCLG